MLDSLLESLSTLLSGPFAAFAALLAGIITSITPCSLSQIPLVLGYVGKEASPGKALRLSLVYAAGSAVTFTAFGSVAAILGNLVGSAFSWWYIILGLLMVLMALQMWGIINIVPSTYLAAKNRKRGYLGALIAGVIGGIFSSPCSTPMLIALIALVAAEQNLVRGILLMLLYSIGCTFLAVVLGASPAMLTKLGKKEGFRKTAKVLNYLLGALVLLIGATLMYLGF